MKDILVLYQYKRWDWYRIILVQMYWYRIIVVDVLVLYRIIVVDVLVLYRILVVNVLVLVPDLSGGCTGTSTGS